MSDQEQELEEQEVRVSAQDVGMEMTEIPAAQGGDTAAGKIMHTLRSLSEPKEDAGELELMFATVAMGLERALDEELERTQTSGELDKFMAVLTRWIATHRSDRAKRLVVVEMPRRPEHHPLPNGTRLHLLDQAEALADQASSPL